MKNGIINNWNLNLVIKHNKTFFFLRDDQENTTERCTSLRKFKLLDQEALVRNQLWGNCSWLTTLENTLNSHLSNMLFTEKLQILYQDLYKTKAQIEGAKGK